MRILLYALLAVMPLADAWACLAPPSVEWKLEKSDVVFSGRTTNIVCQETGGLIEFEVQKIWKGAKVNKQLVHFDSCEEIARFDQFEIGSEHLIYAKLDPEKNARLMPYFFPCSSGVIRILSPSEEKRLNEFTYLDAESMPAKAYSMESFSYDLENLGHPKYSFSAD